MKHTSRFPKAISTFLLLFSCSLIVVLFASHKVESTGDLGWRVRNVTQPSTLAGHRGA